MADVRSLWAWLFPVLLQWRNVPLRALMLGTHWQEANMQGMYMLLWPSQCTLRRHADTTSGHRECCMYFYQFEVYEKLTTLQSSLR
jgi:hypothetical protein